MAGLDLRCFTVEQQKVVATILEELERVRQATFPLERETCLTNASIQSNKADVCPECGSRIEHWFNCPNGCRLAFTRPDNAGVCPKCGSSIEHWFTCPNGCRLASS